MNIEPEWETTKKIVVCTACNSSGIIEREELVDYHKRDYDYWKELCATCGGEGRLVQNTHSFRITFVTPGSPHKYPDGHHDYAKVSFEKLNGRKTEDIYEVRKNR